MDEGDVKVSLCMIVRDCAKDLDMCLASIARYVDEICLTYAGLDDDDGKNETLSVARKYGAKVSFFKWCGDFGAARRYNFSQASHDIVMWLDSDDTVDNAASFMGYVRNRFLCETDAVMSEYLYEFDAQGRCTTRLIRERVVDRRMWEWREPIHECLCATWNSRLDIMPSSVGRVVHGKSREDQVTSQARLRRNIEIFEKKLDGQAGVRMLFYWANTLLGLGRYHEAIKKYDEYLSLSGRKEEQYTALVAASEAARLSMDQGLAIRYGIRAIEMFPQNPSGYLAVAEASLADENWLKAVSFAVEAQERVSGLTDEMVCNPKAIQGRPLVIKCYALTQLGKYGEAIKLLPAAKSFYGDDENLKAISDILKSVVSVSNLTRSYCFLKQRLDEEGHEERVGFLQKAIPDLIKDEPEVSRDIPKLRLHSRPTLAIVCPGGVEHWGPSSLNQGGIGGSETAVVNMASEMASRGWGVEVYAKTMTRGEIDGVTWYPVRAWGGEVDEVDVVVFWRSPGAPRAIGMNAKASYLWLHDIAVKTQWDLDTHLLYDGVMCLSKYHRSLFDWVPQDKIFMTANGLDEKALVPLDELRNDPMKLVWGSCPSRGLQHLLPWWDYLRERFPRLELHIYYGFTGTYQEHMKQDPTLKEIYKKVLGFEKSEGVVWHGMVGKEELYRAYASSGVWPYMTTFPEIYCITADEMQAHGVVPLVADHGSLPERVPDEFLVHGIMDDLDNQKEFIERLIKVLEDPMSQEARVEMARRARCNTWSVVADQWNRRFRRDLECSKERRIVPLGSKARMLSRA